jgi:hypothetical protein
MYVTSLNCIVQAFCLLDHTVKRKSGEEGRQKCYLLGAAEYLALALMAVMHTCEVRAKIVPLNVKPENLHGNIFLKSM